MSNCFSFGTARDWKWFFPIYCNQKGIILSKIHFQDHNIPQRTKAIVGLALARKRNQESVDSLPDMTQQEQPLCYCIYIRKASVRH